MDFSVKTSQLDKVRSDCLIVQVYGDKTLSATARAIDTETGAIAQLFALQDFKLKAGQTFWLNAAQGAPYQRLLLVCMGDTGDKLSPADIKKSAAAVAKELKKRPVTSAVWSVENSSEVSDKNMAVLIAEAITAELYVYQQTKSNVTPPCLNKLTLHSETKLDASWKNGLQLGKDIGDGINVARNLGNLPANICTPTYLAEQAQALASDKLTVKVLDEKQMQKLGMGSLLSVSAGSDQPAKLIVMEYRGASKTQRPTVLVGKGITFDTGGVSLKPGVGMDEMKFDMCGAASVLGVMSALKAIGPRSNVVGIIAAAENMPSGRATKPGDVVTSMSGQTIEVLNTDAEGRLVLCDALTYAGRFKPKAVVDIATLTGACVVALGGHASGLFANDQSLANELLEAGTLAQDRAWQMPLWDEYQKSLDSNFADIANIGGREAGSVTAACFLSRFTKEYKWAHLDIAGTAWLGGAAKSATGRPVGLLMQYLVNTFD